MLKNKLGITMVELVVVVIIILIIASYAVMSGTETLEQADVTEVEVEITSIQKILSGIILKQDMDEDFVVEQGVHYDENFTPLSGVDYSEEIMNKPQDWYIIYGLDDEEKYETSNVKDGLGIDSIKHTYIVNFKTAKVELYRPIKLSNTYVRTFDEVMKLVKEGNI